MIKTMNIDVRLLRLSAIALATVGALHFSGSALSAEGLVHFANTTTTRMTTNSTSSPPSGQPLNATGNTAPAGQYRVGLYIAPQGTTDFNQFTLMGPVTSNSAAFGGGLFSGNASNGYFVISNNNGQPIAFQVRAWSASAGATFEEARSSLSAYLGASAIGEVTPAIGLANPPSLFGTSSGQVGGFVLTPNSFSWPNTPPFVAIRNLTNGQLFAAPANVPVHIRATDREGSVTSVTVRSNYANTAVIPPPYTFTFSNLAPGFYRIEAQAADNQSAWGNSAPVFIRVANPPVLTLARSGIGPIQFQFNSATGINYVVESGTLTNFSPVITNRGS